MINIFPKKYFIFSSFLFLCGYLTTIIFPDFYVGTDYFFYIELLKGNKTPDYIEPITSFIFSIFATFSNAEISYKALGILSLLTKSYFISLLLEKTKKANFSIFLYILIYFISFYSRYEIGSLRNAFGIDVLQFFLIANNNIIRLLIIGITLLTHLPTGLLGLLWFVTIFIINKKDSDLKKLIQNIQLFFTRLKIKKIKKIKVSSTIFNTSLIVFFLTLVYNFRLARVLQALINTGEGLDYRYINIFTFHRIYIILFTLIASLILYMSIDNKGVISNKDKRLIIANENLIPLYLMSFISLVLLSFVPLSLVSQRIAYIICYFCMISNIIVITIFPPIKFLLKRTTYSIFKIIILSLISLSLISGDLYKALFREQYTERIENLEESVGNDY